MRSGAQDGSETLSPVESQIPGRLMAVTGRQLLYLYLTHVSKALEISEGGSSYFTCHAAMPALASAKLSCA